jgi:hypothetical protein
MDRSAQFRHLAEAERYVALGAQHISGQELALGQAVCVGTVDALLERQRCRYPFCVPM